MRFTGSAECGVISARGGSGGTTGTNHVDRAGAGGGGGGGRVVLLADSHKSCSALVDAGLAGNPLTSAVSHGNQEAHPNLEERSLHAGIFIESLAELASCPPQGKTFIVETPANGARVNTAQGLVVKGVSAPGVKIEVNIDSFPTGQSTVANAGGTWTVTVPKPPSQATFMEGETYGVSAYEPVSRCITGENAFTVDTKPPDLAINSTPLNPSKERRVEFTFSTSATDWAEFQCSLDGEPFVTCTSGRSFDVGEGAHVYKIKAVDKAGNSTDKTYTWRADFTPPTTTLDVVPPSRTNLNKFAFVFSSTEDIKKFRCSVDVDYDWAFSDCVSGQERTFSEGRHTFYVRAEDAAGNKASVSASHEWVVDSDPPDIRFKKTPDFPLTNNRNAVFEFSSNDDHLRGFQCSLCRSDNPSCGSNDPPDAAFFSCIDGQTHVVTEGVQHFHVRSIDTAGNKSSPLHYSWSVDLTSPNVAISTGPERQSASRRAEFEFSSSATDVKEFQCAWRPKGSTTPLTFSKCLSPHSIEVGDGSYVFTVRAVDLAGNKEVTASREWEVDTTAPTASVNELSTNKFVSTKTPVFIGTTSEYRCTVKILVDGTEIGSTVSDDYGYWVLVTRDPSWSLDEGRHTVSVRAKDTLGNEGAAGGSVDFIVDTKPPETNIVNSPPPEHGSYKSDFTFSASEKAGFECKIDSDEFSPCLEVESFDKLKNGKHVISVRARDEAGNVDPSPAVYEWIVSFERPLYPDISEPANGARVDTGTPTISGRAAPNGTVTIFIDGELSGSPAFADSNGLWTFRPPVRLEPGLHSLSGETTDVNGTPSESRSPETYFTIVTSDEVGQAIGGGLGCNTSGPIGSAACFWGLFTLVVFRRRYRS